MKWNSVIFIIGFIVAFAGGYFIFGMESSPADDPVAETPVNEEEAVNENEADEADDSAMDIPEEVESLSRNGCLGCHAVESMGVTKEGENIVGPDLSEAYEIVEGKHGKELDDFLQDPTSAVMATIIDDDPLDDDEREQIVEVLKKASENHDQQSDEEEESANEDDSNE